MESNSIIFNKETFNGAFTSENRLKQFISLLNGFSKVAGRKFIFTSSVLNFIRQQITGEINSIGFDFDMSDPCMGRKNGLVVYVNENDRHRIIVYEDENGELIHM